MSMEFDENFEKWYAELIEKIASGVALKDAVYTLYANGINVAVALGKEEQIRESDEPVTVNDLAHIVTLFRKEVDSIKDRLDKLESVQNPLSFGIPSVPKDPFPMNMQEEIERKVKELEEVVRNKDWNVNE